MGYYQTSQINLHVSYLNQHFPSCLMLIHLISISIFVFSIIFAGKTLVFRTWNSQKTLQDLGFSRSTADQRALLSAAHALGDATLAAEVLEMQARGVDLDFYGCYMLLYVIWLL